MRAAHRPGIKNLSPPEKAAVLSTRLAHRGASSGDVRLAEQGAAPAGVVRDHALGGPRDPAPRHYDRAQGALLEGTGSGNRARPEKRGPGDLKSPLVERRKARGLKPMRPHRIRKSAVLTDERRPVLHLPLVGGSDCRRARAFQTTGPAELWLFENCLPLHARMPPMSTSQTNQPRRTLLLTGASRGIGHATVKRFSAAGWSAPFWASGRRRNSGPSA